MALGGSHGSEGGIFPSNRDTVFSSKTLQAENLCLDFTCFSVYLQAQIALVLLPLTCLHAHQLVKRVDHLIHTQAVFERL